MRFLDNTFNIYIYDTCFGFVQAFIRHKFKNVYKRKTIFLRSNFFLNVHGDFNLISFRFSFFKLFCSIANNKLKNYMYYN
jgi:hypothetical protein